jgi:hypothetical protein
VNDKGINVGGNMIGKTTIRYVDLVSGTSIREGVKACIDQAKENDEKIVFSFNGCVMVACSESNFEKLVDYFYTYMNFQSYKTRNT